jgi:uncharacterized integral membrane protein
MNLWVKIKVWTKMTVVALVAIYLMIFVIKNSGQYVVFWYWHTSTWPLLAFTFFTFLAGVVVTLLVRTTWKTIWQIRDMRKRSAGERAQRELADMRAKAAMLQTKPSPDMSPSPPPNPSA